jgi:hypothetical protein
MFRCLIYGAQDMASVARANQKYERVPDSRGRWSMVLMLVISTPASQLTPKTEGQHSKMDTASAVRGHRLRVHQFGSFVRFDHMFLRHDDIEFE